MGWLSPFVKSSLLLSTAKDRQPGLVLEIQSKPAHPATIAMSPTNAFTTTVSFMKMDEAAFVVCWGGGGLTVWLAVTLLLGGAADDDAAAEEDLPADAEDAEEDAAEELELEPPPVTPPVLAPGSVLWVVFWAAAAYAAR